MMTRRMIRVLTMALCLVLCVCAWPSAAFAFDPVDLEHATSLTIFANDEETPLPGVTIDLYLVAGMNDLAQFELTAPYQEFFGDINKMENTADWMMAAEYMLPIAESQMPAAFGVSGEDGLIRIEDLAPGLYLVTGEPVEILPWAYTFSPFLLSVPTRNVGDEWVYYVYSDIKLERVPAITDIEVVKLWDDLGHEDHRPNLIYVDLYQDGVDIDTAMLHDGNSWSHKFTNLPAAAVYTVKERDIPRRYEVSYETINGVLVIRNKLTTPETPVPDIPATGQLWWPVPILAALGMILFVMGWITHRKWSQEHE